MSRVSVFLTALAGLGLVVAGSMTSHVVAQTALPPMPSAFRGETAPIQSEQVHSATAGRVIPQAAGIKAVCASCGKPFIYHPVVKPYFVGADAPEPKSPPAGYDGPDPMYDIPDPATHDYRLRDGITKPLPFREGPYGHTSRYAKVWDEEQMLCDECLAVLHGKLAGRTMFSAAPTRPGLFGFGVAGGVKTIFQRGPEGERFYGAKTFFDEAEDPPYWPRQYKVQPIYSVPNGNVPTYVRPYQFPNSRHKGNVVTVPALSTY